MIFAIFIFVALYPWLIYPLILICIPKKNNKPNFHKEIGAFKPSITVIVPVFNEEKNIEKRILNIYDSNYPSEKLKVIVVSDGSKDNTVKIARNCIKSQSSLKVIDHHRSGRAVCHNYAASISDTDILLFTDSDTQFSKDFITNIVKPFKDPLVGISVGRLIFKDPLKSTTSQSFKFFWYFELILRELEDRIGLFIFGTGACMAIRRLSYTNVPKKCDVDFILALDVAKNNLKITYQKDALAFDYVYPSSKAEYNARVRQVSRNFSGYLNFWKLKDFIKFPGYSFVLVSHKYLRWLSPLFLLGSLLSSFFEFPECRLFLIILTFVIGFLNLLPSKYSYSLGPFLPIYNFCLISRAFIYGSFLAMVGSSSSIYDS